MMQAYSLISGADKLKPWLAISRIVGLDPDAPMARYNRMGLIWMLHGEPVINITATTAKLSGGLAFYRKNRG